MKHTVEDRVMVASNVAYMPLRAFMHHQRDKIVCYSQVIREITTAGQLQADRVLVITDKHLYVVQMPGTAIFSPPTSGGVFSLTDFSKMSLVVGTQHCIFQFVGATIAMRFTSAKDAERCGNVIYSLTAIQVESISPAELGSLHARRVLGAPNSLSQSVNAASKRSRRSAEENHGSGSEDDDDPKAATGNNSTAGTAIGSSAAAAAAGQRNQRGSGAAGGGAASSVGGTATGSVDNMLRFILESNDNTVYESLFPEAAVQTEHSATEMEVQAVPETRDAATSPIRKRDLSSPHRIRVGSTDHQQQQQQPPSHGPSPSRRFDFDDDTDDSASGLSEFDSGQMWRSLHRNANGPAPSATAGGTQTATAVRSTPRAGGGGKQQLPDSTSGSPFGADSGGPMSFDSWLGILTQYKQGLVEQGLDSIGKISRLSSAELDSAMDAAGISRAGHRVLLTSKINVARQSRSSGRR
jgi:hypothetical protein